jgi:hypothetical protein
VHDISIFKKLYHVHMDVYLEHEQLGTYDNSTSRIVLQDRSNNGHIIHSGTPIDTSIIQEERFQMVKE